MAEHSAPGPAEGDPLAADGARRHSSAVYRLPADDLATAVKHDGQGSNS
jgi:hypothetical protein